MADHSFEQLRLIQDDDGRYVRPKDVKDLDEPRKLLAELSRSLARVEGAGKKEWPRAAQEAVATAEGVRDRLDVLAEAWLQNLQWHCPSDAAEAESHYGNAEFLVERVLDDDGEPSDVPELLSPVYFRRTRGSRELRKVLGRIVRKLGRIGFRCTRAIETDGWRRECFHTPDFTSVCWFGPTRTYTFNESQRRIVRALWHCFAASPSIELSSKEIRLLANAESSIPRTFRHHPAYGRGRMIVPGDHRGCYRLAKPDVGDG